MKYLWHSKTKQKIDAMDTKKRQLEEKWKHCDILQEKERMIASLRADLEKSAEEVSKIC